MAKCQETEKIVLVQSYIRRFLAKKEMNTLRKNQRETERKVLMEKDGRRKMERNVVIVQVKHSKAERERETVQKHIRGFLARRRVGETIKKEMANLEKEAIKAVKPPQLTPCSSPAISRLLPNPLITSSTPELLVSFLTFRRKICTF